jgi:hypothetical protein
MLHRDALDLQGRHVAPLVADHVLLAVDEEIVAVGIADAEVPGVVPAAGKAASLAPGLSK